MKLSKILFIAVVMALMAVVTSCRDELCYGHYPTAGVSFEWEQEWERDYGMNHRNTWDAQYHGFGYDELRPGTPEWVNIIKFGSDGSRSETFLEPKGGDIILDEDQGQSLLLYNGDTQYIVLSDVVYPPNARASATGRSRSSLTYVTDLYPNARTTSAPDALYAAYVENIPGVKKHEKVGVPVNMKPLVYTYHIRYEFEYGVQHIALARGALGGMAESVYLLDGHTSDESSIILYDCALTNYGCEAQVSSFGVPGFSDDYYGKGASKATDQTYTLNLEVRLTNGKDVEFNFDISDQIARQPRGGVIKVSGIRIEDYQNTGGTGFNPTIEGWGKKEDIILSIIVPIRPSEQNSSGLNLYRNK